MNTNITKVSVFLRKVGSSLAEISVIDSGTTFDVANFSSLTQGNPNVIFDNSVTGYYGNGYMAVLPKKGTGDYEWPILTYPIVANKYGKYTLYLRVRSSEAVSFSFSLAINSKIVSTHTADIDASWTWVSAEIVIQDTKSFNLSIVPQTENVYLDSIHLTQGSLSSSIDYSSSFITLHMKIYEISDNSTPTDAIPFYGYKTSISEIIDDNWYGFEITPLTGISSISFDGNYAVALFASGTSDESYLMWDYSSEDSSFDPYTSLCSLTFNETTREWNLDCDKRYAIRAYSYRDALDEAACKIIVPASALATKEVRKFDSNELEPIFVQTKIVDIDGETNKVELSLPDKLISVVMDQSGSLTWNDSEGLRHTMTQRMVDRLESTYPGDVRYNLIGLGSTPIKVNFFAVVESDTVNTSDTSEVASSYFADQESGYAGVRIIRKIGSYPTGPLDGEIVTEGFVERAYDDDLTEDQEYFYAAYTFNADGIFSEGRFLTAVPRIKNVPHGVGGFTYRVVTGSGVKRDEDTVAIWHLNESSGDVVYDFSNNPIRLSSSERITWLNSIDVPSGVSGIRLNGSSNIYGYDSDSKLIQSKYTFMAWVYPFNFSEKKVFLSRESSDDNKMTFKIGTNVDGTVFFSMDDLTTASSSGTLELNQWNHVAVTVDVDDLSVRFYINGSVAGTGSITTSGYYSEDPMNIYIGGKSSSFFGKITEVSIHKAIRSANYIYMMSELPLSEDEKIIDNGDRIVVLKYVVPPDFNYTGGSVSIIRKQAEGFGNFSYQTPINNGIPGEPVLVFDGFGEKPASEIDGDLIYTESATVGEHIVTLPLDYVHGRIYHFRIYSKNSLGNYSLASDSPILSIEIPKFSSPESRAAAVSAPFIERVQNVNIQIGNHKNYITWDAVSDEYAEQILVYWSDRGYPIINNEIGVDSSALLVFSGSVSDVGFVDRNLENEIVNYYAIVAADRFGNFSAPVFVSGVPLETADETNIPLLEVKQFRHEIVNENAISIAWDSPVKFQKDIQAWFDQRVALYAQITDEFGSPIADASNIRFSSNAAIGSAQLAENVFGENIDRTTSEPDADQCYILSSTSIGNGFLRGVFRMTSDLDILSSLNSLSANIVVSYTIPDRENPSVNVFEFTSLPIHIEMHNPFAMELINIGNNSANFGSITTQSGVSRKSKRRRSVVSSSDPVGSQSMNGDTVKILCKQTVPLDDQSFISSGGLLFDPDKFKSFDGCWIRRQRPFMARIVVTYRGQSLPFGSDCNVAVYEASDPQCDPDDDSDSNPCSQGVGGSGVQPFVPGFSNRRSRTVQPPATSIPMRTGLQTLTDGTTKQVSYADIPLRAPDSPQAVMLFGKAGYNGYYARKKMYIVFDSILRVETTIEPPDSNCIDVAEQQARVYMIDPDSPDVDRPRKIPIEGQQVVRWTLRKGRNAKDRPFFSTDNVPAGPGVFSYTRNGTARRVFFGPACGVSWELYTPCPGNIIYLPELYAIKASVVYDGLSAFEERPALIYPPNFAGRGFGSRFLMTTPQYVNTLYADGYQLLPVTIYHDPNITGGVLAECFRTCAETAGKPIFVLDNGQIVDIESGSDFEILYGDDLVTTYDEELEEYVVTQANEQIGFAQVPLAQTGNSTSFYLRVNKFIGRSVSGNSNSESQSSNICSCIEVPPGAEKKKDLLVISGSASINFDGETRYLRGGGDVKNGVPPTTVELKEPLDILIVDIRRNGSSVEKVLCDGISVHEFVVEVIFKQKPVPNGTPVFLTIAGKNPEKIILLNDTVYTEKVNDSILNPTGSLRSFASFFIAAIGPEVPFEAQVQAETTYDKRGDVERSMTCCVTIKYDPSQPKEDIIEEKPEGEISNVFSGSLDIYDTVDNSWETKTPMNHPRGCLTLNWTFNPYGEQLYAIGGLDGKSILGYNERYDVESDTWTTVTSMSIPRFYHMTAQDGNYIYVFGGIVADGSNLAITDSIERYNTETDTWETVGVMPSFDQNSYGVALGACVSVYGKAYIIGGIRKIGQKGSIDAINDRILVFNFDTLTWGWSDAFVGVDLLLYERVSPFVFADSDGTKIHVIGGAIPGELNTETGEQPLEFKTDSFVIDLSYANSESVSFPFNSFPLNSFPSNSFPSNSFNSDGYLDLTISLDDYLYNQIPSPRYRGVSTSIYDSHYFLGGSSAKSQVLSVFDLIEEGSPTYSYDSLTKMPTAKTSFGGTSDQWRYIYTVGGLTSGRPAGFLQINASANPSFVRLDGKQSATIAIELINDVGERPSNTVRVLVQGILLFPGSDAGSQTDGGDQSQQQSDNSALRDALVYPVIFSSNDFYITNGLGSTIMLPRSDDILKKISEIKEKLNIQDSVAGENGNQGNGTLKIVEGETRNPYSIKVRITVIDDFFYGQTIIDIKDNTDSTATATPSGSADPSQNSGNSNSGNTPSTEFNDCRSIEASQAVEGSVNQGGNNQGNDNENNRVIDQTLKDSDNPVFDLAPPQTPQLESPEVVYYSDIEWIPQIITYVNNGKYEDMTKSLGRLRNEIPFGASPLYDALVNNSSILLDESLDVYSKVIYVNTDNEENLSVNTLQTAIEDVQAIDGFAQVPVVVNNFSVVFPVTLSALLARTDLDSLETIASETGGESQTILDAAFIDDVLNNSLGRVAGSIGWGLYECVVDLQSNSIVNSIILDYDLFANTDGNWKVATSTDGFNYSEYSDSFSPNTEIELTDVSARFLKFRVTLLSGLSSFVESEYELIPSPGAPSLTGININYSVPTESFIFLTPETTDYSPQQIAVSVSATKPKLSQIEVGVTTSNSYNWNDYKSGAQPPSDRFGKVFIPIRYNQENDSSLNEPLESIDGFMWKAKYGRWDTTSSVEIRDVDGGIIDSAIFKTYPQDGFIIFDSKQAGPFSISIENAGRIKLGIRILNMDSNNPVTIDGVGYMYNTNVFLPPPLSQRPPVVSEFRISPSSATIYQKLSVSYKYFDINKNDEDTEQTEIRWYINGVEIEYLRNLRSWNDIEDVNDPIWIYAFSFQSGDIPSGTSIEQYARQRQESILKVDDSVYATIKVSDGTSLSNIVRSPSVKVIEAPPFISTVSIKGKKNSGLVQDTVTTATRAFADFEFFQDGNGDTKSQIVWYVNGVEFKRGDLGATVGGISNNEILVGEIKNNIIAIAIGNTLEVTILPATENIIGNPVTSAAVSVENDPPSVRFVTISPNPRVSSASALQLTYTYVDNESQQQGSTQSDQSSVRWFKAPRGSDEFVEVSSLQNVRIVPAVNTSSGEKWKAEVIPFDGISVGDATESNTVEIV